MLDELVARYLKDRDEAAIEELVRRTRPRMLTAARRIGAPQDAEDAVHAAYLSLLHKTELDAPVLPWLLRAVIRIAYRHKAKARRLREVVAQLQRPSEGLGPAATAIRAEELAVLRRRVADLPETYRDPLVLHYLEGLSTADVAQLLDLSRDAVKKRLERARRLLRNGGTIRLRAMALLLPWWEGAAMKKTPVIAGLLLALLLGGGLVWRGTRADDVARARPEAKARSVATHEEAPGPKAKAEPPAAPAHRITGRVLDADGNPVRDAQVVASPWSWDGALDPRDVRAPATEARSGADGAFAIGVAESQIVGLQAYAASGHAEVERVREGDDIEIRLRAWRSFHGVVKDLDGVRVPGARVRWLGLQGGAAVERVTESDAEGRYRLARIPHEGVVARWIEVRAAGYAPLFFTRGASPARGDNELDLIVVPGVTLAGTVVDGATGRALPDARVVLWSTDGTGNAYARRNGGRIHNPFTPRSLGETKSDHRGRFTFEHVPNEGFHPLDARFGRTGRLVGAAGAIVDGYVCAPAEVVVGATAVKVVCWPRAEIEGRVVDPEGKPLAGVAVWAYNAERMLSWRPRIYPEIGTDSVKTDADGRYTLPRVAAGTNAVHARPGWWPSMLSRDNSVRIETPGGRRTRAPDIVVKPLPYAHLDVDVVDGSGRAIRGARVSFAHFGFAMTTDDSGRTRLYDHGQHGSSGAPHRLYVRADGYVAHTEPVDPAQADAVRVVLKRGRVVAGKVTYPDGSPVPGVLVAALPVGVEAGVAELYLPHPARDGKPPLLAYVVMRTGVDGAFRLAGLPESCTLVAGAGAASKRADAIDGVTIVMDAAPAPGGAVTGTVRDAATGKPILRVTAGCHLGNDTRAGEMTAPGRFRIRNVTAGDWTMQVLADGYVPVTRTVRAGDAVDIEMTRAPSLRGRIRGIERIPSEGRRLLFVNEQGGYAGATVGADGGFEVKALLPGRWRPVFWVKGKPVQGTAVRGTPYVDVGSDGAAFDFALTDGGLADVKIRAKAPRLYREGRFTILDRTGATVMRIEGRMAMAGRAWPLPVGGYTIAVRTKDGQWNRDVEVRAGETVAVEFDVP